VNDETQTCLAFHYKDPERPRQAMEGTVLCAGHGTRLFEQLAVLPSLREELTDVMARAWSEMVSDDPTPLAIAEKALPLQPDIADLRGEIESQLMSYARMVAEELDGSWPPVGVDTVVPWLQGRLEVAARQEWIVDMLEGVDDLVRQAHGFLDAAKHRLVYLGKCGGSCDEPIFAKVRTGEGRDEEFPIDVVCPACETQHDVALRLREAQAFLVGVGNARQVAERADVPWGTVRAWASAGRLSRLAWRDERGNPLYRVADVVALKAG
jgi:hypothetical protein